MITVTGVQAHPYVSVTVDGIDSWVERFRDRCQYADQAIQYKNERDGGSHHHITIANWKETKKHNIIVPQYISFEVHGIGMVVNDAGNEAWFLVISSPELAEARANAGLPPKDFHVTLGFIGKDVHNVPKDETTLVNR